MAEQYLIKFSSDKITADGKDVAITLKEAVDQSFAAAQKKDPAVIREDIAKNIKIRSKRDTEKEIIQAMLQTAFKAAIKPQDFKLLADIDATVENADESFKINIDEWKKYVQDQFEATIKRLSVPVQLQNGQSVDGFPYYWKHCKEIMSQLYAPALFKPEQVEK